MNLLNYATHENDKQLKETEKYAIQNLNLKGNVRNVYSFIVRSSFGNKGACKYLLQTIADKLNVSKSTAFRSVKKLKELELIEVHADTKGNGIKGANIYSIIFLSQNDHAGDYASVVKMNTRETHGKSTESKDEHTKKNTQSLGFKTLSNPFVINNVNNNVKACDGSYGLAITLKEIYDPQSSVEEETLEELKKIAFGRIKQYISAYKLSYPQIESIVVNCMYSLVIKSGVKNQAAMYSGMIKRQVEQLVTPVTSSYNERKVNSKEKVPDWFNERNSAVLSSSDETVDFELERQKILSKLGSC